MGRVYRSGSAQILINSILIGCCSNVTVEINENIEDYYGIERTTPETTIAEGTEEISGSMKRAFINTYYLSLMGLGTAPFTWTNNIEFDLIFESSSEGGGSSLHLYNCRFKKVSITIPANGWIEENYDFISIGIPSTRELPMHDVDFLEPVDWGYFKVKGEIWIAEPTEIEGGGYFIPKGGIWIPDPSGTGLIGEINGGGYFTRH